MVVVHPVNVVFCEYVPAESVGNAEAVIVLLTVGIAAFTFHTSITAAQLDALRVPVRVAEMIVPAIGDVKEGVVPVGTAVPAVVLLPKVILAIETLAGISPEAIALKLGFADAPPEARKCVVIESGPTCTGVLVPAPTCTA